MNKTTIVAAALAVLIAAATVLLPPDPKQPVDKSPSLPIESREVAHKDLGSAPKSLTRTAIPDSQTGKVERPERQHREQARPSLASDAIQRLTNAMRVSDDRIEREQHFRELLAGLTAENAKVIRNHLRQLPKNKAEMRDFYQAWGQVDGATAIANGAGKQDLASALTGWASIDPASALEWYRSEEAQTNPNFDAKQTGLGLLEGLIESDPAVAEEFVFEQFQLNPNDRKIPEAMMRRLVSEYVELKGIEHTEEWATELTGQPRQLALMSVAHAHTQNDPAAAAEWAEQFVGVEDSNRVFGEVVRGWMRQDPAAAIAWTEQRLDVESKSGLDAQSAVYGYWSAHAPEEAFAAINAMPEGAPRDFAINGYVQSIAVVHDDHEAAIALAQSIDANFLKHAATVRIANLYKQENPDKARTLVAQLPPRTANAVFPGIVKVNEGE